MSDIWIIVPESKVYHLCHDCPALNRPRYWPFEKATLNDDGTITRRDGITLRRRPCLLCARETSAP